MTVNDSNGNIRNTTNFLPILKSFHVSEWSWNGTLFNVITNKPNIIEDTCFKDSLWPIVEFNINSENLNDIKSTRNGQNMFQTWRILNSKISIISVRISKISMSSIFNHFFRTDWLLMGFLKILNLLKQRGGDFPWIMSYLTPFSQIQNLVHIFTIKTPSFCNMVWQVSKREKSSKGKYLALCLVHIVVMSINVLTIFRLFRVLSLGLRIYSTVLPTLGIYFGIVTFVTSKMKKKKKKMKKKSARKN